MSITRRSFLKRLLASLGGAAGLSRLAPQERADAEARRYVEWRQWHLLEPQPERPQVHVVEDTWEDADAYFMPRGRLAAGSPSLFAGWPEHRGAICSYCGSRLVTWRAACPTCGSRGG